MSMSREEYLIFYIRLLEIQIEALKSVVAEFDTDGMEYTQGVKSRVIDEFKNSLVRP
jgi:hypothetical protein